LRSRADRAANEQQRRASEQFAPMKAQTPSLPRRRLTLGQFDLPGNEGFDAPRRPNWGGRSNACTRGQRLQSEMSLARTCDVPVKGRAGRLGARECDSAAAVAVVGKIFSARPVPLLLRARERPFAALPPSRGRGSRLASSAQIDGSGRPADADVDRERVGIRALLDLQFRSHRTLVAAWLVWLSDLRAEYES
jgi:hypothetical protein